MRARALQITNLLAGAGKIGGFDYAECQEKCCYPRLVISHLCKLFGCKNYPAALVGGGERRRARAGACVAH